MIGELIEWFREWSAVALVAFELAFIAIATCIFTGFL